MVEISKRLYTEEKPGDLEDTAVESSQNVMQWRHRGKESTSELWDKVKEINIHLIGV